MFSHVSRCQNESKQPWGSLASRRECVIFYFLEFFLLKKFSLRLFLYCSYFSSDFSLNVLIKFVLNKKREYIPEDRKGQVLNKKICYSINLV